MKYKEIYNEYSHFLLRRTEIQSQLQSMPKGYISVKVISGKEYHYLQHSSFGKKKSEYIKSSELDHVRCKLQLREQLSAEMPRIESELSRLERAAAILDNELSRHFVFLKQCADMDAIPVEKRSKVLSFAKAMTALEGLPTRQETENNLYQWARGEKNFADFYLPALESYRILEATR